MAKKLGPTVAATPRPARGPKLRDSGIDGKASVREAHAQTGLFSSIPLAARISPPFAGTPEATTGWAGDFGKLFMALAGEPEKGEGSGSPKHDEVEKSSTAGAKPAQPLQSLEQLTSMRAIVFITRFPARKNSRTGASSERKMMIAGKRLQPLLERLTPQEQARVLIQLGEDIEIFSRADNRLVGAGRTRELLGHIVPNWSQVQKKVDESLKAMTEGMTEEQRQAEYSRQIWVELLLHALFLDRSSPWMGGLSGTIGWLQGLTPDGLDEELERLGARMEEAGEGNLYRQASANLAAKDRAGYQRFITREASASQGGYLAHYLAEHPEAYLAYLKRVVSDVIFNKGLTPRQSYIFSANVLGGVSGLLLSELHMRVSSVSQSGIHDFTQELNREFLSELAGDRDAPP